MRTAAVMRRTMPYYSFYPQTPRSVANCRDYRPTMGYAQVQPINLLIWAEMVLATSMSHHSPQSKSKVQARPPSGGFRGRLHEVVFEADTRAGRAFDVALIGLILLSVLAVMLESISGVRRRYGAELYAAEWAFTILFTVEYVLRLASVRRPLRYATSFFGVVDLLAIIPTYLSLLVPGSHSCSSSGYSGCSESSASSNSPST